MIEIKLVPTNVFTRWGCTICGGHTEKDPVLCEGENDELFVRICPECLRCPETVDDKIEQRAIELEQHAQSLRSAKSNLSLPSYEDWERAVAAWEEDWRSSIGGEQ